jgi:crotonobetainyl-CoA:carnitine CoA-transferase CaiB-like acyl-CoA transferase
MVVAADGMRQYAPPFRIEGVPFEVARGAPAQGEHSVEVLREAGLAGESIDALVAAGVVRVSGRAHAR